MYYIHKLISSKCFHPKKSSSELFNGVHCLSALYVVRNLLTKLIEFQTVPCHSFQFVQFWKISIMIRTVSFCSVSFLFVSYRFKYKLLAIHYVPFRCVSFPRSQAVCSSSTRCLYFCLLFRITVNYAELGINVRTSPKNIRSQKILFPHIMSKES